MDVHKVLQYLRTELDKQRAENAAFLAQGRAASFDEYRHVCGIIRGLTSADATIVDLVQRLEHSDD